MAEVFKARTFGELGFARFVAIKKILPHLAEDSRFVDMFITEAKTAVRLTHANIAQIHELGRQGDDHYIAMEYIAGKDLLSLHHHFRKTRVGLPIDLVAYIGACVAEGLAYAHRKKDEHGEPMGIVHRDVSPQNVLVSYDGQVKLIDFGIAKARVRSYQATQAGVLKGKFGYMSPEQITGKELDNRSDIFALGTVLHELLTRRRLFHGENDFVTLELERAADVPAPSSANDDVPAELDRILLRALHKDPDQRYGSASDLAEDLGRFLHGRGQGMSGKGLADWMRTQFAEDIAKETAKDRHYAKIVLNASGQLMEAPAEDDEEPTALWDPVFEEGAPGSVPPPEVDPLEALERAGTEPPTANPFSSAPTGRSEAPTPPRRSHRREIVLGVLALVTAVLVGAVAWRIFGAGAGRSAGLVLRVTPIDQLTVTVDGRLVEGHRSPIVRRDLAPGAHDLRVTRPGHRPWTRSVVLEAGPLTEVRADLDPIDVQPAKLRVVTIPAEATVDVGGRRLKPEERGDWQEVAAGQPIALRAVADGYHPAEKTVTPEAGSSHIHTLELEATPGSLFVDSSPSGKVFLDGKYVGRTPYENPGLDVRQPLRVKVVRAGYAPHEEVVNFGKRRVVQIEAKLKQR